MARASPSWISAYAVTLPVSAISAAATYPAWNAAKLCPPTPATTLERMATPSATDVCRLVLKIADASPVSARAIPVNIEVCRARKTMLLAAPAMNIMARMVQMLVWASIVVIDRQNGLGSASCGPGVLPQYKLQARAAVFSVRFRLH